MASAPSKARPVPSLSLITRVALAEEGIARLTEAMLYIVGAMEGLAAAQRALSDEPPEATPAAPVQH